MSLGAQQIARLPKGSCAESPGHRPWRCHGAWEPVIRFFGQGLSHTRVFTRSLPCHLLTLTPSHSHTLLCVGPNAQPALVTL